jgi:hypothetical protein
MNFFETFSHRIKEIHAFIDFLCNQMSHNLRIRLGGKFCAPLSQLFLELEIVFDDPVVHDHDVTGAMGVGVGFRRPMVSRFLSLPSQRRTVKRPSLTTAIPAES